MFELKWLREEVAAKNMEEIHKNFEQSASGLEDLKAKHANLKQKLSSNASNQTLAELNRRIKQTQTMLSLKKAERSNIHDEIVTTAVKYFSRAHVCGISISTKCFVRHRRQVLFHIILS